MKQFKCALFNSDVKDLTCFEFIQEEIVFENFEINNKAKFSKTNIKYKVLFEKSLIISDDKIPLIIPIKDMPSLLEFTLNKLIEHEVTKICNVIVVDDRSEEDIEKICQKYDFVSYIRVDNDKGFNYSILANIAAYISHCLGFEEIIFWNSDMWPDNSFVLKKLIDLHRENKCTISGTKLLYPKKSWNGKRNSQNIINHFPDRQDKWRGTVQFGGSLFIPHLSTLIPMHLKRFAPLDNPLVNSNYTTFFVTGAYCFMDLKWLISDGGFNPSLSKVFNDVDICLRATEQEKNVMYFGKDLYLEHDESVNLSRENKMDKQFTSDSILYSKIWDNNRIMRALK